MRKFHAAESVSAYCNETGTPMRILMKDGLFARDEILKIYKECSDRRTALEIEYNLVKSTPKLLNRPYSRGRAYA